MVVSKLIFDLIWLHLNHMVDKCESLGEIFDYILVRLQPMIVCIVSLTVLWLDLSPRFFLIEYLTIFRLDLSP